ncbi:FxsA family protein [Alteromonas halophila]|uniref:Membrane protein FxsA n=1 Tax=Alteromonas halophila TaxID=516698 RepID=A0A918JPI1_9ALTE|nr:FxsA family protein [Alteromonas halophila]GGW90495.1 membrane protein FxsA [Alteromonas halophila]
MRLLFLLFAAMPIIEIAVLVQVGGIIGGWNTIALVIITAFAGAYLVRREGLHTLQTAQQKMQQNTIPGRELVEGMMLVVAGILLVTPGFITDILGFLFVLPGTRHILAAHISKHMKMRVVTSAGQYTQTGAGAHYEQYRTRKNDDDVIEGEYADKTEQDPDRRIR